MFFQRQADRITDVYHEYPAAFWRLVGVTFVDRLGGSLLYPFFALYITSRFGVGMTQVGVLFSLFFLSSFVGSMVGGALTDRIGRRSIVIFSLLTTSISSVAMGLVGTLEGFFMVALVGGVFNEIGGPAYQAMVADLLPREKRAQGYGIIRVAFNLAVTIGPAIGGFLATRSYLMLFVSDALISTITAGLVFFTLPETKPEPIEGAQVESLARTFGGYFHVLRDAAFMGFLGAAILMGLVYMNMGTTLGVYLRDVHGVAESGYGLILSLNAAMVVLLQFPITRRIEGLPPMLVMAFGTFLYALGFGLYGLVSSFALFLLAIAIVTIGEMLVAPVAQAVTATLAPEDMRGRYMAVFGFSFGIPFAIGPLLAGLILDNLNPNLLWLSAAILGTIAAFLFLLLHRSYRAETVPSTPEPQPPV
ncbi:MAG: MFS transporter [Anaerolineales bacterium]